MCCFCLVGGAELYMYMQRAGKAEKPEREAEKKKGGCGEKSVGFALV